ncbi:MAG: hypothetical protein WDO73_23165 [Ignavibacteriota bacterium]
MTIDGSAIGYPRASFDQVPAGEYYVQAVLNIYEAFHRSDGHVVKLPMDQGEGQHWNRKPGNLYSEPVKIKIGRGLIGRRQDRAHQDNTGRRPPQRHQVHQACEATE